MKKILIICLLFQLTIYAQKQIESAKGYGKIILGMNASSLHNIEPAYYISTYQEEKAEWIDRGYNYYEELVSQIPFDESYTFLAGNKHGLWTVYLKDKKVVIIQISKKYFPYDLSLYPSVDEKINFGASVDDIEKVYGTNYIKLIAFNNTIGMNYLELGIAFNVWEEEGFTTLYIFEKMDGPTANRVRQKMMRLTPAEN